MHKIIKSNVHSFSFSTLVGNPLYGGYVSMCLYLALKLCNQKVCKCEAMKKVKCIRKKLDAMRCIILLAAFK